MTRKPIIAGNWKMNKTVSETKDFITAIKSMNLKQDREIVVCTPFTALSDASRIAHGTRIEIGAQNMHFEKNGAFTGEISADMLKEFSIKYVIIGHSERRHVFKEDDVLLNKKVKAALANGLKPIFCVGETLVEREAGKTDDVVKNQVVKGLEGISDLSNVVIAYEPVWAIGTGKNATPQQAEEVHHMIRALIKKLYNENVAGSIRILYGGSVKPDNVKEIMNQDDVDGVLVGGASLDAKSFEKLVNFDN